ncbi:MAG: hypothetical protein P4M00_00955 [Azospirillaceae bacterium]|nr:hypothetical protein [Azospirillaceae bacterium]
MGRRRQAVMEGQLYRKKGPGVGTLWEVVSLRGDGGTAVHVQLKRCDDPSTLKTLAVTALLDPTQFVPVAEVAPGVEG